MLRELGSDCEVLTVTDAQGTPSSSVVSFYFRDEVLLLLPAMPRRRASWPPMTSNTGN
ncbi:hypothetical protein PEC18_33930 [Paucibacter sp. O1-1]|nr:hypothetical protein [Paucibacter sp. O1-1]MDA3830692.1 hypothetical protein [Paucibacter sp. O1-1]